jgi:hypothetical protein
MQHTQENADAPSEPCADSAQVHSGFEKLDLDAAMTAFKELDKVLNGLAEQVVFTIDQIIPHLAEMQV